MKMNRIIIIIACLVIYASPLKLYAVTFDEMVAHKTSNSQPLWGDNYKNIRWVSHTPYLPESMKDDVISPDEADYRGQIDVGMVDLDGDKDEETIKVIWGAGVTDRFLTIELYESDTLIGRLIPEGIQPNFKVEDVDGDGTMEVAIWGAIYDPDMSQLLSDKSKPLEGHSSPHFFRVDTWKLAESIWFRDSYISKDKHEPFSMEQPRGEHPYLRPAIRVEGDALPDDNQLRQLLIEKGLIPVNPTEADKEEAIAARNSTIVWALLNRDEKLNQITRLIEKFDAVGAAKIELPPSFYVDEINATLYYSFKAGELKKYEKKGLGVIFRAIATINNDYNDHLYTIKGDVITLKQGDATYTYPSNDDYPGIVKVSQEDIDGDGINEYIIAMTHDEVISRTETDEHFAVILICEKNGNKLVTVFRIPIGHLNLDFVLADVNQDGIKDVIATAQMPANWATMQIVFWTGDEYKYLWEQAGSLEYSKQIFSINDDGIAEITTGYPPVKQGGGAFDYVDEFIIWQTWVWNGEKFVEKVG